MNDWHESSDAVKNEEKQKSEMEEDKSDRRVRIPNPRKLFALAKASQKYVSWNEWLKEFNIGNTGLKRIRRGEITFPSRVFFGLLNYLPTEQKFEFLKQINFLPNNWGAKKGGTNSIRTMKKCLGESGFRKHLKKVRSCKKKITWETYDGFPDIANPELCELFGAMLGDGHCGKYFSKSSGQYVYHGAIVGNAKKDVEYVKYLDAIIRKYFPIKPAIFFRKDNSVRLQFSSRLFYEWLLSNGYHTNGKPKDFGISNNFLSLKTENLNFVIRGLLDTDGHMNARKDERFRYPYVTICSYSPVLRNQIKEILLKQGIKAFVHAESVSVRGIENTHKWFELIGSSNPRILNKYKEFCETGKILPGPLV
ncbi:MAG: LAGLIDADG family homing endonuclease [archaeon]